MTNDFLFELGCEELPSASVFPLAESLKDGILATLEKAQLKHGPVELFATPRRLAVLIRDLEEQQPSQIISRRGPALNAAYRNGEPTQALIGFAKSCKVEPSELSTSKTDKGEWVIYETTVEGQATTKLLPALISEVLARLPIAKPMRWGDGNEEFARPVHWVILLFGEEVIPATILGVSSNCLTYGHRFHFPHPVAINQAQFYESLLRDAFVIADFNLRRENIIQQVTELAALHNAEAIMPESLVDEVTSIVEWPQAILASFEEEFLEVPPEALIASMQSHQKCFALQDKAGNLLPHFITVANIQSSNPNQVALGNEKVMRARLSDAAFFFEQDKKQPLSERIPATTKVVFQAKLGSLWDKAKRIEQLMKVLAPALNLPLEHAKRAAELSKCDLMTGMVGEFPELQGLMGFYYAQHDGEPLDVAIALKEQYMPRFAADELPLTSLGLALSLADRLDTLVGIFAIGEKPSGVKDPFKLRRHALAVARMLISIPAKLNLSSLIQEAKQIYQLPIHSEALDELKIFILERMQSYYQNQNKSIDLFQAVRARQDEWLYDFDQRIQALADFTTLPDASSLAAACKRVNNILQQAEFSHEEAASLNENLLTEGPEKALFDHLQAMEQILEPLYETADYRIILKNLASLREPVDAFFEHVMVMVDEPAIKTNRLHLLLRLQQLLQNVADISLLQLNS
ncbi:glycine--tRNA ligase subunit beta [Legionella jordanis]|uniref:Glycine--tRNA ligase beta subunit n=1 Tax=Legionella jordanis TaxID=456 RepID=A0A0W0V9B6_9GAMM|nr:glycine--tRNA ligase subunit beta [Legionella jordanis]KTD16687.1 glycyl-tRNA synthetase beta chain [Legionella jordanis]RMX03781.1 glycine--tRNA ligase subunit beta [Legionella jordanis]RMX22158.1 glycine--tRNA ligase subunit beta [Legionella jordanis]VEH11845.1 glycyl-tRNA synthetase beta chain [Legionella jordanis]